jgi:hypothetical protein
MNIRLHTSAPAWPWRPPGTQGVQVVTTRSSRALIGLPRRQHSSIIASLSQNGSQYMPISSESALDPDVIIDPDGTSTQLRPLDPQEKARLWKAAIKAPMYSVGLAPILVTAVAAWANTGAFDPLRTLGLCIAAISIIAWLNLSNDVFDSATGVDKTKPESVVNLTGSRRRVFVLAHIFLLAGAGLLFSLLSSVVSFCLKNCICVWLLFLLDRNLETDTGLCVDSQIPQCQKPCMQLFVLAICTRGPHFAGPI